MPEQPAQKTVSISIQRKRPFPPKIFVVTGFKLKLEPTCELVEIFFQIPGQKGEKIAFDPIIIQNNLEHFKRFVAAVPVDPDESAKKEDISVSDQMNYANVLHMSRMGNRGETTFSIFSLADWVEQSRQPGNKVIESVDSVVAVSTAALQKKLVLEIILTIEQLKAV
jgi:hypothetical protein